MADALHTLSSELDLWAQAGQPVRLWLRDDDAIAPSPALARLAHASESFALPVLLAVIPMLAEPGLARALAAMPSLLPCQHGCWHRNHAGQGGKKSEFGETRTAGEVGAEIALARRRLDELLGAPALPVFVPPWNRITPDHAAVLPGLGLSGLSCFRGFGLVPGDKPGIVNTDIDVMDWQGGRISRSCEALAFEIGQLLARRRQRSYEITTLGLLLHHRDHDEAGWRALDSLLAMLLAHPTIEATDPRQLFSIAITA